MNRVKTGVKGLDEIIEGGIPEGRTVLLTGGCGTGKTIMAMQFVYSGAKEFGENGVYVTLDERPDLVREDMIKFGMDIKALEKQEKIHLIDGSIAKIGLPSEEEYSLPVTGFDLDKLLLEIMRSIKKNNAKRVVIDSIPALGLNFENEQEVRKAIIKMGYILQRAGSTVIIISEIEDEQKLSKYGVEEFVADGVIVLHYLGVGSHSNRTLHIRKMRSTKHSEEVHPLKITDSGIKIGKIGADYSKV